MSWPRTKVEIEVEENESLAFQFLNHPKYPQPSKLVNYKNELVPMRFLLFW